MGIGGVYTCLALSEFRRLELRSVCTSVSNAADMKAACEDCSCAQSYPHAKHDVHAPQSEALIATGKELPFARHR